METDGASQGEQLLDAARRNNIDLLDTVFEELNEDPAKIADVVNHSKDPFGNTALHLCCRYGSWDVLDKILDQEGGIEVDPHNTIDGDTPLHAAVKYAQDEPEHGLFIVQNLIEVGADPRAKNNNNEKPIDLIHSSELDDLVDLLQGAELVADNAGESTKEEEEEIIDNEDDEDDDEDDDDNSDDADINAPKDN
ncbi:similar to Saccharomyces cerevisiae YGL242C Putative protein of unknown function [Maudiozyma saulgeensis]|uniref:Uncharacterized protein n=1 Tax=Maudiozyma saulgeensis TaxID=1789683 RepID=A0A1X7RAQ4_9SACH|nr:similar to Saccharomyces cerevisiae YGL242C Putative protein of unknown function [Kazachstania saulgeensis]